MRRKPLRSCACSDFTQFFRNQNPSERPCGRTDRAWWWTCFDIGAPALAIWAGRRPSPQSQRARAVDAAGELVEKPIGALEVQ